MNDIIKQYREKAAALRAEEKKRLLAVDEKELSIPDWYQRMRYLREDEAQAYLRSLSMTALAKKTYVEFRTD